MWLTVPLALSLLAPPEAAGLTLTNVRSTFGPFGGTRPAGPLLPGDALFLAFDINGVAPNPDGKATYTMEMVVKDAAGKAVFGDKPTPKTDDVPLGGSVLPGIAFMFVGPDRPPGQYTLNLTVTDDKKQTGSFAHPFSVAPKGLGVVSVGTSLDDRGQVHVPNGGFVGQTLICHFYVVGFARQPKPAPKPVPGQPAPPAEGPQPNVEAVMTITENGKPVLAKPAVTSIDGGLKEDEPVFNLRYPVPLTRPGKFVVTMTVTDKISNKTASFSLPLTASPPPG